MPPAFIATAAVTFIFTGASNSTARTIPTADAVFFACNVWDGTSDTVAATIAGAAPTKSYQGFVGASGTRLYAALFVGAPSGSQTVAVSGGDAGDEWACGFKGVNTIDTTTPFDGEVTDTASAQSISVATTGDGLAVGVIAGTDADLQTSDTEEFETALSGDSKNTAVASAPATGGSVSLDWTASGGLSNFLISLAMNFRMFASPDPHRNERRVAVLSALDGWGE